MSAGTRWSTATTRRCSTSTASSTWDRSPSPGPPRGSPRCGSGGPGSASSPTTPPGHPRRGRAPGASWASRRRPTTWSPRPRPARTWSSARFGPGRAGCSPSAARGWRRRSRGRVWSGSGRPTTGRSRCCRATASTSTWHQLNEAAIAIHRGAHWVATNTDPTRPTERGLVPGNGAAVAAVAMAVAATPEVAGQAVPAAARRDGRRGSAASGRSSSATGWTPTSPVRATRVWTACWCSPGSHGPADLLGAAPSDRPTHLGLRPAGPARAADDRSRRVRDRIRLGSARARVEAGRLIVEHQVRGDRSGSAVGGGPCRLGRRRPAESRSISARPRPVPPPSTVRQIKSGSSPSALTSVEGQHTTMTDARQNYLNLVAGLTQATRDQRCRHGAALLAQAGLDRGRPRRRERVNKLAEEILHASKANRELVENLLRPRSTRPRPGSASRGRKRSRRCATRSPSCALIVAAGASRPPRPQAASKARARRGQRPAAAKAAREERRTRRRVPGKNGRVIDGEDHGK